MTPYDYVVIHQQSWEFGAPLSVVEREAGLPNYGDVWARRVA
jgi:hypothetical protein